MKKAEVQKAIKEISDLERTSRYFLAKEIEGLQKLYDESTPLAPCDDEFGEHPRHRWTRKPGICTYDLGGRLHCARCGLPWREVKRVAGPVRDELYIRLSRLKQIMEGWKKDA